jgi:hypothetical protein
MTLTQFILQPQQLFQNCQLYANLFHNTESIKCPILQAPLAQLIWCHHLILLDKVIIFKTQPPPKKPFSVAGSDQTT